MLRNPHSLTDRPAGHHQGRRPLALMLSVLLSLGALIVSPQQEASAHPAASTVAAERSQKNTMTVSLQASNGALAGTDALGRELPLGDEVPAPRRDRSVGVFYVLWHGTNDHRDYKNVFNNSDTLAADPDAAQTPDSGAWPSPGHFAYWGEPLYGYYRSDDEWVMRRHLELLSEANVDYLLLDTSNNELYKAQAALLMRLIVELQAQGVKAPQVAFMTHTDSTPKMDELYRTFYAPDAPYRYPSTWYHWDGKPLILGENPSAQVREFFTFRWAQWPNEPQRSGGWDWISFDRPQRANMNADGTIEQMAVSTAQNSGSSSIFSYTALEKRDDVPSRSRNFHNGAEDESPGAVNHGYNFQEEWDHAIDQDPETILVLEWNEWIAGNWASRPTDLPVFYDVVDTRWNRDIEMMRGGFGDNYYLQLIDNIRRYKGAPQVAATSPAKRININGSASQWNSVKPLFRDYLGETAERNHAGTDNRTYINTTGRNDIATAQVAHDADHLYFRVTAADKLTARTDDDWMTLWIDVDGDGSTGWNGYDYAINRTGVGKKTTTLERARSGWDWQVVTDEVKYKVDKEALTLEVDRRDLAGLDPQPRIAFKWSDNVQAEDDAMGFYLSGDVAPSSRLNFVYDAAVTSTAPLVADTPVVAAPKKPKAGFHRIEDGHATESKAFLGPNASDWVTVPDRKASGGSTSYAFNASAQDDAHYRNYVRSAFDGHSVRWVTETSPLGGEVEVFIDGLSQGVVNLYSSTTRSEQRVFERYGLPDGRHEIWAVWKTQNGRYTHDYFEYGTGSAHLPRFEKGENVSPTAWTTGSSFAPAEWRPTNPAQLADSDPSTYWRAEGSTNEWVELNLGRRAVIDRLTLAPRQGAPGLSDYRVEALVNGRWKQIHSGTSLGETTEVKISPVSTTRLRLTANADDAPVEVAEFGAFTKGRAPQEDSSPTHWEFRESAEGWSGQGLPGLEWAVGGKVASDATESGARFVSPSGLDIDARRYGTVSFRLSNSSSSTQGTVYFASAGQSFDDARSKSFRLTAGQASTTSEYTVDLSTEGGWTGMIDRIAIDLGASRSSGASVLDYVRLAPDNGVIAWQFQRDTEGWVSTSGPKPKWNTPGTIGPKNAPSEWEVSSPTGLRADITNASVVKVRTKAGSVDAGRVFFATEASPAFDVSRSAPLALVASDGRFDHFQVDLAAVPGWSGRLDSVRLALEAGAGSGPIAIDAVSVEPYIIGELGTDTAWEFDTDTEGWGGPGGIADFAWQEGGYVGGRIVQADPQIYSPDKLWLDLDGISGVNLRMEVESSSTAGTLYFTTEKSPNFSQDKSVPIPLEPSIEGFREITLDFSGNPAWSGLLKQLRFDPAEGGGGTGSFRLDHIRMQDFVVDPVRVTTTTGVAPELPTEIRIAYADGSKKELPVAWGEIAETSYAEPGTFTVPGQAEGGIAVTATVTVLGPDSSWEFTASTEGWGAPFGIERFEWDEGGYVRGENIWYGDAQFFSPDGLGIDLTGKTLVKIGLRNETDATRGTFFFTTTAASDFSAEQSVRIPLVPNDDRVREYVLDVSATAQWDGILKQIRLDPADDVNSGDFLLDYVRIEEADTDR